MDGSPETFVDPTGHSLVLQDESAAGGGELAPGAETLGSAIPQVFQDAFDAPLDTSVPPATVTQGGTTYVGNADGSITVTQTTDGSFTRLDTYGQMDSGYKTLLGLLLSAINGVNAAAIARATDVSHQTNAFTAENDRPAPVPVHIVQSIDPTESTSASEPAPQPATDGAGAWQGGGIEPPGAKGGVYTLTDPETGQVMRTGRTNDLARRAAEHSIAFPGLTFDVMYRTDNYATQRGLEQLLYEQYPNAPLNRMRGIDPRNPNIEAYRRAADVFLNTLLEP